MDGLTRRLFRPRTLALLTGWTVICVAVATPTKDAGGLEGVVSWITFFGFWAGLLGSAALGIALLGRRLATR